MKRRPRATLSPDAPAKIAMLSRAEAKRIAVLLNKTIDAIYELHKRINKLERKERKITGFADAVSGDVAEPYLGENEYEEGGKPMRARADNP